MTASNRAAMVYTDDARSVAVRLDVEPAAGTVMFLEDDRLVARRDGDEDLALLDAFPEGRVRAERALRNPNAGEVLVSAAAGHEFVDLAGRHHLGGGSHGSLDTSDSEVPMLTIGLGSPPRSITGIKPLVVEHFRSRAHAPRERCGLGRPTAARAAGSTTRGSSQPCVA